MLIRHFLPWVVKPGIVLPTQITQTSHIGGGFLLQQSRLMVRPPLLTILLWSNLADWETSTIDAVMGAPDLLRERLAVDSGRGCFAVCVIGHAPEGKPWRPHDRDPVKGRRAPVHQLHQLEQLSILPRVLVHLLDFFYRSLPS
jgi:hypothetical protein